MLLHEFLRKLQVPLFAIALGLSLSWSTATSGDPDGSPAGGDYYEDEPEPALEPIRNPYHYRATMPHPHCSQMQHYGLGDMGGHCCLLAY